MDFSVVNLKLLAHPVNWGIVWVTLLLVVLAYTFVHDGIVNMQANQSIIPN